MNYQKINQLRDVLKYVQYFQKTNIVIYMDNSILQTELFYSHLKDIFLIDKIGINVILILEQKPLIKPLVFARSQNIIKALSNDYKPELSLETETNNLIKKLENFNFQCINYINQNNNDINTIKDPLSIAVKISKKIYAEKLFFLTQDIPLHSTEDGMIHALNLKEAKGYIKTLNKENELTTIKYLEYAIFACKKGIHRTHILNILREGCIPTELFSAVGSGTMIYKRKYDGVRPMTTEDIQQTLQLIKPFVKKGILLKRKKSDLQRDFKDYIIYEIDGSVKACAALHLYTEGTTIQAEIAALAVSKQYERLGIGVKLINFLIQKAKEKHAHSIFALTTHTGSWFEKQGFKSEMIETLPKKRQAKWTEKRNSKAYRLFL